MVHVSKTAKEWKYVIEEDLFVANHLWKVMEKGEIRMLMASVIYRSINVKDFSDCNALGPICENRRKKILVGF